MSPTATFELILFLLVAILGLELLARRLSLPPAAALICGGIALALIPGVPTIRVDHELFLVLFLPPLLMEGAYFTALADFRRYIGGILSLAVGAVVFTTVVVGVVAHWAVPALPWAACFALGAVVSPPDAVAAKAVLGRVQMPRRMTVLLEGESLLNDAAGLVLVRFAVAAAATGTFSVPRATGVFLFLGIGGVVVGGVLGYVWVRLIRFLKDTSMMIAASVLLSWTAYVGGEALHVSGVIAVVTAGLVFGWYQHEIFSAAMRIRGSAFWQVMVFLMESFVFILIGLSLRGVIAQLGGPDAALRTLDFPLAAIVVAVVTSRFVWILLSDTVRVSTARVLGQVHTPFSGSSLTVLSWAGMRGAVTLAIALSIPETMPGQGLILASAFVVILVTIVVQGTTLGPLIRMMRFEPVGTRSSHLTRAEATARLTEAQLAAVERLARREDGTVRHVRLLEQYQYRARASHNYSVAEAELAEDRAEHYKVLLAAIAAGREEILRLHRTEQIHDDVLHDLEHNLDLQELAAESARL